MYNECKEGYGTNIETGECSQTAPKECVMYNPAVKHCYGCYKARGWSMQADGTCLLIKLSTKKKLTMTNLVFFLKFF